MGDCVLRAITKACNVSWDDAFWALVAQAYLMDDVQISNAVMAAYLRDHGFRQHALPNTCPACYTVERFCIDHPRGIYIVATGSHVVSVVDGCYFDSWDSGQEICTYYFEKEGR